MILCGQHSLEIFCLGIFLSFLGHFVMSKFSRSVGMQILISVLGILTMIAGAWLITWYKHVEGRGSGTQASRRMPTSREARHESGLPGSSLSVFLRMRRAAHADPRMPAPSPRIWCMPMPRCRASLDAIAKSKTLKIVVVGTTLVHASRGRTDRRSPIRRGSRSHCRRGCRV